MKSLEKYIKLCQKYKAGGYMCPRKIDGVYYSIFFVFGNNIRAMLNTLQLNTTLTGENIIDYYVVDNILYIKSRVKGEILDNE